MTEVERIVQNGVVSADFLLPEKICDFLVTEKSKKIWAISIDLLVQLDAVCRKHGLKYSLGFGSLLGIVRHHGFIPWDDDVDVVMPRADYEKLKKYKNEFRNPYFLQFPGEDNGYALSFAKLRNSNTTSISWPFRYETFNQGIFLDIFPLDNYSLNNFEENYSKIKSLVAECSASMRRSNPHPDDADLLKLKQFPIARDVKTITSELDSVLRINEQYPSNKYIIWSFLVYDYQRMTFSKDIHDDLVDDDFYGHSVYVPRNADEILRIMYGDYMKMPPVEQRGVWHNKEYMNPDIPYKVSLQQLRKFDITN